MCSTRILRPLLAASGLLLAVASAASAQPSRNLNTYVLVAQDNLRIRGTTVVNDGDIGVNEGLLYFRGTISAPKSDIAATIVHMDPATYCEDLFANAPVVGGATSCPEAPQNVPHPLIGDLAEACGFPAPDDMACSTDSRDDRVISHDQSESLLPGKYRNLVVEGGGEGPATLKLNGTYHFCNVRVGRQGSILFTGPSTVTVAGSSRVSNAVAIGPDPSLGAAAPPAGAIKWFIGGTMARFSRRGQIGLHACAPNAKMLIGSRMELTGQFVARSIRMKKATVTFAPIVPGVCGDTVVSPGEDCETTADCPSGKVCMSCACIAPTTTTSGSSTTTTTVPGECDDDEDCNQGSPGGTFVCENGHCVPGCDDDEDCNQGSPDGTFVCENGHCVPGCDDDDDCNQGSPDGVFVCENGHCVPASSTTTTTTTTPRASTTSTTLHPCTTTDDCPTGVCKNGVCVPECQTDIDCKGSPGGSFVCIDQRCVARELCDDCRDNDGDGLTDFEDPDCCSKQTGQLFDMDFRKGRLRAHSSSQSTLRLKGTLARGLGNKIDPTAQQVGIQIRNQADGEVLCASVPSGKFLKKRKGFRFSNKRTPVPVEIGRNLDRVQLKVRKTGDVRFSLKAKRAMISTPAEGTLEITIGFTRTGAAASQNVCSQAVRLFRGGKKGRLRFP